MTIGTVDRGVVAVGATIAWAGGETESFGTISVGLSTGTDTTGTEAVQPGVDTVTLAPINPADTESGGKLEQADRANRARTLEILIY